MTPGLLFIAGLLVSAHAFSERGPSYDIRRVAPLTNVALTAEVLPAAQFLVPLTEKVPRQTYKKKLLEALRTGLSAPTAVLAGSANDVQYLANVTVGGEMFKVIVDTGSSDTWVVQKGFECFNLTSYPEKQSNCAFGSSGFNEAKSKTFASYPDKNFNITYRDGEFLTGAVGFDTVIIGDMVVNKQEIGLVNKAAWSGDGINSGLVGLAYPGLTNVYNGTDPDNDVGGELDTYNPLFFTALSEKVVSNPYFSVALNRGSFKHEEGSSYDPNLGYLAFGGIAPVNTTNTLATIPIQGYTLTSGSTQYLFYTVEIDSYIFSGSAAPTGSGKQAILDTGTTLNYIPNALAKAYNSKFVPPATYVADEDTYFVDCNATVPAFAVQIGGTKFTVDAADNILPRGTDSNGNEICISGTQNGGNPSDATSIFILGDVFLHNVVATFNVQSNKITITQRKAY